MISKEKFVEIINRLKDYNDLQDKIQNLFRDNIDKDAIEHILQDYERQKQINEEHRKINGELREKIKELEIDLTTVYLKGIEDGKDKYKQKIKNKKEEFSDKARRIAGTYQYADSEDDLIEKKNKVIELRTKAESFEELLKESEDK